jgi:flagellar biosynthesis protein FlhB
MITINFDKTVDFLFEISELKNENLISIIKEYIQIIIIVGFCLAAIIVLDLVCLFFYRKSILNEKDEYSQELTSGDPILRKLKGLEDSNL